MRYALLIGNTDFEDKTLSRLSAPKADIENLAGLLSDKKTGNFDHVDVELNSTSQQARRKIARFFSGKSREDLLLLYYTGHGILDLRGNLYLAFKDTEKNLLRGTAIQSNFITEEMDSSRSQRQILILDSCHSGAFVQGTKGATDRSVGIGTAFKGSGFGRVIMTASDTTQYAWEGDKILGKAKNSLYSHYLIQGIRSGEADLDQDGAITISELHDYVYEHVLQSTPNQTPLKWAFKQQGDIVVAQSHLPTNVTPGARATEDQLQVSEGLIALLASLNWGQKASLLVAIFILAYLGIRAVSGNFAAQSGLFLSASEAAAPPDSSALPGQIVSANDNALAVEPEIYPVEIPGVNELPIISPANIDKITKLTSVEGRILSANQSADGDQQLLAFGQANVITYNLSDAEVVSVIDLDDWLISRIESIAVSQDYSHFAIATSGEDVYPFSDDPSILVWDLATGQFLYALEGYTEPINVLSLNQDGSRLLSSAGDNPLRTWDLNAGEVLFTFNFPEYEDFVSSVAFHPSFQQLAIGGGSRVYLTDPHTGNILRSLQLASGGASAVAYSPDGLRLAAANYDDGRVYLFSGLNGGLLRTLPGSGLNIKSLAFSPTGTLLASSSGNRIEFWNVETGELLNTLNVLGSPALNLIFSLDGTLMFSDGEQDSRGSKDDAVEFSIWLISDR